MKNNRTIKFDLIAGHIDYIKACKALIKDFNKSARLAARVGDEQMAAFYTKAANNEKLAMHNRQQWLERHMEALEAQLSAEGVEARPRIEVFYESGYRWSAKAVNSRNGEMSAWLEDASNMLKNDAIRYANAVAAEFNAVVVVKTMTKEERAQAVRDRWEHTKEMGYTDLAKTV